MLFLMYRWCMSYSVSFHLGSSLQWCFNRRRKSWHWLYRWTAWQQWATTSANWINGCTRTDQIKTVRIWQNLYEVTVHPSFLSWCVHGMQHLVRNGKENVIEGLARGFAEMRPNGSDSRLPVKRMPFGLISYCVDFFNARSKKQVCSIKSSLCTFKCSLYQKWLSPHPIHVQKLLPSYTIFPSFICWWKEKCNSCLSLDIVLCCEWG